MRILIVEDEATSRILLERCLASLGEIRTADDGEAGLAAFKEALQSGDPVDLVCLDIVMPKLNGQEVLKQIREMENIFGLHPSKRAVVFMTTSQSDRDNLIEAIPLCDAYLTKPINRADLMFYVKKHHLPQSRIRNTPKEEGTDDRKPWGEKEKELPWVG
jgi:two-component system chemotaxis response regulator CheY